MLVTSLLLISLFAGDDLASGPNPGDKLQEFKVLGFSGPQEGKEFEVLKETKNRPTVLIFVNGITRPTVKMLRPIDERLAKEDMLATHIIWLGEREETENFLKRAKNSLGLQTPMSISLDGKDGPAAYGLNNMV